MPADPTPYPSRRRWPAALLVIAFLALALPLILTGNMRGRGAGDQINFHEKAIRTFAAQWPRPDLHDYLSATTPAYHLILAAAARAGLESTTALRLISCAIGAGLILTLGLWVCRRLGAWESLAACLPVAASLYIVQSGAWLLPDNAGWWGVLAVLLLSLRPKIDAKTLILAGAALLALVLIRQVHIWAAGAIWAAAWMGSDDPDAPLLADLPRRIPRAAAAFAATLPAFAALIGFYLLWGGLTPPNFQVFYSNFSPAAPAFVLALLGIGSCFFAAWFAQPLLALTRRKPAAIALAAAAGAVAAIIPPTSYANPGRYSGIWNATKPIPLIANHTSPLILALAVIGAIALLGWCIALHRRERWIMLAAFAAFTAAQAASGELWQRYSEPFVLIMLALMAALVGAAPNNKLRPLRIAGPLLLSLILLAVTLQKIRTDTLPAPRGPWNPATGTFNALAPPPPPAADGSLPPGP